jgi:uncharacterized linocin/CFP29 family protein
MNNIQPMASGPTLMMGHNGTNLGRDKLPWSKETWNRIDQAVHDEVQRIRINAKVFPVRPYPNARTIPSDIINGLPAPMPPVGAPQAAPVVAPAATPLTVEEGAETSFIEISRGFALTENQCEQEETLGTAAMLSRFAATAIAMAEDMLIFQGGAAQLPPGVVVQRAVTAGNGLLGLAVGDIPVNPIRGAPGTYGDATFTAVTRGIAELQADGQPGPYALFLGYPVYADTYRPIVAGGQMGSLITVADRIVPLVSGGFHGTSTLPPDRGVLVSLAGEPTTISVSLDAVTSFTQQDVARLYQFNVVERIQYRARDPRAIRSFTFA